ncbi:MAG: carboxypeptidase-like regulatory domain-containing protein [Thermoplasmatota archaeon]
MAHRFTAFLACLLLAGCTNTNETPTGTPATTDAGAGPAVESMELRGQVLAPSLAPISNATVIIVATDLAVVTGADGFFDFGSLEPRIYTLVATAAGYLETSLTVTPEQGSQPVRLVMQAGNPVVPYRQTYAFAGIMQCAFEALIISPSCDSALTAVPGQPVPPLFDTNQSFLFQAEPGWKTLVVDVVFDAESHPGLAGLRITVRGSLDPDGGGEYAQYGRWYDAQSFTASLEPGGRYDDGTEPVPDNATGFQVDTYPHSHFWHAGEASPFLGVGFAQDLRFDVYATLFYVEPAPEDFTLRSA